MELLHSEAGLTLVGSVLGTVWTFFRSRDWYERVRRRRFGRAVTAVEAGVELAYRTYIREIKKGRADGKLTEKEMERAREKARRVAIKYGRTTGVDVARELGDEYFDL